MSNTALKAALILQNKDFGDLAEELGLARSTLSRKLNHGGWKISEKFYILKIYGVDVETNEIVKL